MPNGLKDLCNRHRTIKDMRRKCMLLIVAIMPVQVFATTGWYSLETVTAFTPLTNGVEVRAGDTVVRVVALNPAVIRVRYARHGIFRADESFAVVERTGFVAPLVQL